MLELFLKLVDKAIEFSKQRATIDRAFFTDHVDPMFSDLRKIVDDYRTTLKEATVRLEDMAVPVDHTVTWLSERREALRRIRSEVQRYSDALVGDHMEGLAMNRPSDDASRFAIAVYNVLTVEPTTDLPRPWQTRYTSLLRELREAAVLHPSEDLRDFGVKAVKRYQAELDGRWEQVTSLYYSLRVQCLR